MPTQFYLTRRPNNGTKRRREIFHRPSKKEERVGEERRAGSTMRRGSLLNIGPIFLVIVGYSS